MEPQHNSKFNSSSPPLHERPWSHADLLTVSETAKRLKIRATDARQWLRQSKLICNVVGRERVIWGEVIKALGGEVTTTQAATPPTEKPQPIIKMPLTKAF